MTLRDLNNEVETMEVAELGGILLGVLIAMIILSVITLIIIKIMKARNEACPLQQAKARVADKQQLPGNAIRSLSTMWVVFELENGIRKRMIIPGTKDDMIIGDVGVLSWQGEEMVSFTRNYGGGMTSGSYGTTFAKPAPPTDPQGYIPAWKRVEMMEAQKAHSADDAKQEGTASRKCIFCGEAMAEKQTFCGSCGRRID